MSAEKKLKAGSNAKKSGLLSGSDPRTGTPFDWGCVEPGRLHDLIQLVTGRGGAIRFGYSRDGIAGSIGVYYGEDRDTRYIRPSQDPEEVLGLIERTFEAFPDSQGRSPNGE